MENIALVVIRCDPESDVYIDLERVRKKVVVQMKVLFRTA